MANFWNTIAQHNKKILGVGKPATPECRCENGECPVEGKCGTKGVVYQATVKYDGNKVETYVGLTERKFIERHTEHYRNFEDRNPKNSTKLSKLVWRLEDEGKNYELKWEILRQARPYNSGDSECRLC